LKSYNIQNYFNHNFNLLYVSVLRMSWNWLVSMVKVITLIGTNKLIKSTYIREKRSKMIFIFFINFIP